MGDAKVQCKDCWNRMCSEETLLVRYIGAYRLYPNAEKLIVLTLYKSFSNHAQWFFECVKPTTMWQADNGRDEELHPGI